MYAILYTTKAGQTQALSRVPTSGDKTVLLYETLEQARGVEQDLVLHILPHHKGARVVEVEVVAVAGEGLE